MPFEPKEQKPKIKKEPGEQEESKKDLFPLFSKAAGKAKGKVQVKEEKVEEDVKPILTIKADPDAANVEEQLPNDKEALKKMIDLLQEQRDSLAKQLSAEQERLADMEAVTDKVKMRSESQEEERDDLVDRVSESREKFRQLKKSLPKESSDKKAPEDLLLEMEGSLRQGVESHIRDADAVLSLIGSMSQVGFMREDYSFTCESTQTGLTESEWKELNPGITEIRPAPKAGKKV